MSARLSAELPLPMMQTSDSDLYPQLAQGGLLETREDYSLIDLSRHHISIASLVHRYQALTHKWRVDSILT